MARYSAQLQNTPHATNNITAGRLVGRTGGRTFVDELHFGSQKTPADAALLLVVDRLDATGAGTGTAKTPVPFDPADAAAGCTFKNNFSAEPTNYAGTPLLVLPFHMRGMCHWGAAPGREIVLAAAVTSNLGVYTDEANGGGTVEHNGTLLWRE